MLESEIATAQMSLEMLNLEHLKAKHGIHWLPSLKDGGPEKDKQPEPTKDATPGGWQQQVSTAEHGIGRAANVLIPALSNKRFQKSDWNNEVHEDAIWFDVAWDTSRLERATRAVKGSLSAR